jgi:molybdopterin-guanine dinucleotide biosynthesis protein A
MTSDMRRGAIILCGGKSSRMGRDKASLPFGPELMLQRVARIVGEVVPAANTVVVAASHQMLPPLPADVLIARDVDEYRGPLAGLAVGLRALVATKQVDAVYATGCDAPLLVPAFIERIFDLLGDYDAAAPFEGGRCHSLAAVYRPSVLRHIEKLLSENRLRPRFLFDEVRALKVPLELLSDVDPHQLSLENLNSEQDYLNALVKVGLAPPPLD